MEITTTKKFTEEQSQIALFAKALGHPARVKILQYLFESKTCVCGDIVEEIGLAQSTISQHLKELKKIGLIQGTVEGTSVCYCIDTENWIKMKNMMNEFFNQDITKTECC
ncbi:ArsR/SmtB family transcription factor [Brumimicrobium aurantiacum]|uniref:ArsR family transcriptional regulator n=1 Tax=Brumimicrobium aurantiacum TaxID=1737063 RepID=A0A3E1F2H8_9FLAO|nr:metalloregulator ArsR/SmtB family transcription factor [Brumimicrobium aurantiacum]RFC55983.1 ArsR family transcriptional regulator [Brumimicrobium aurantiacum]